MQIKCLPSLSAPWQNGRTKNNTENNTKTRQDATGIQIFLNRTIVYEHVK